MVVAPSLRVTILTLGLLGAAACGPGHRVDGAAQPNGETPNQGGANTGDQPVTQGGTDDPGAAAGVAPGTTADAPAELPFAPVAERAYVNKIKTLLTGLPASPNEVQLGASDAGLAALVDGYLASPAYQDVLLDFFRVAFQQKNFTSGAIKAMTAGYFPMGPDLDQMGQSFPRTARYFVNNNVPFNQLMTTQTHMVTPRLLWNMAMMDQLDLTDAGGRRDVMRALDPNISIILDPVGGTRSLPNLLNRSDANFLRFHWPLVLTSQQDPLCKMGSPNAVVINNHTFGTRYTPANIFTLLNGGRFEYYGAGNKQCLSVFDNSAALPIAPDSNWSMVTFHAAGPNDSPNTVLDLEFFRQTREVNFRIPRVSFFTTPAFLAQWSTNINNQGRSTISQTLITGLNKSFNGSDATVPTNLAAIPPEHAPPNSSCYACHLTMDPMRQYFRSNLTFAYTPQQDPNMQALPGAWGQDGKVAANGNLLQLGQQLADSPVFALGWTRRVCAWLNSAECSADDPELVRIADNFARNKFNFNQLVKDMATSPLTTYKAKTKTATDRGVVVSMARFKQMCQILSARLNRPDFCGLQYTTNEPSTARRAATLLGYLPEDDYARGSTVLSQTALPNMLQRVGLENVCSYAAQTVVDVPALASPFNSADPAAVQKIATQLMGLSAEADAPVLAILQQHYKDVLATKATATVALRSTFVLACLSPFVSMIGS